MVIHDLNLAARYSDELIAVSNGTVYAQGSPHDVMTQQTVKDPMKQFGGMVVASSLTMELLTLVLALPMTTE